MITAVDKSALISSYLKTDCKRATNRYAKEDVVDNPNREDFKNDLPRSEESREKRFESMKYEINRLNSFLGKWTLSYIRPKDLSRVGFFFVEPRDVVQCTFCRGIISAWSVGDDPLLEHSKHFPLCPFLMGRDVGNIPIVNPNITNGREQSSPSSHPSTSQYSYKPKFPTMVDSERRLKTFRGWPLTTILPQKLAETGFYYTEIADVVTCFFCGGSLGNWDVEDDPVAEHEKFFPDCAFLKLSKSRNFNRLTQNQLSNGASHSGASHSCPNETISSESANASLLTKDNILTSEIVEKASEIFSEPRVKEVVLKRYNDTKRGFASLQELCNELLEGHEKHIDATSKPSEVQVHENKSTDRPKKDILLCKICMDNELGVVFLPCGHLISCEKCSKEISTCPLCRKQISSTVRTYMS